MSRSTGKWGKANGPLPGPESPFFQPSAVDQASDRKLRLARVILFILPGFICFGTIFAALNEDWWVVLVGLIMLGIFSALRGFQIRALTRELARRRDARQTRT